MLHKYNNHKNVSGICAQILVWTGQRMLAKFGWPIRKKNGENGNLTPKHLVPNCCHSYAKTACGAEDGYGAVIECRPKETIQMPKEDKKEFPTYR